MADADDGTCASSKIIRHVQQTAEPKDMNRMGEAEPGGMQPGASNGPPQPIQAQPPKCTQCGSKLVWKDGLRYLADGSAVQRWLCRGCGFRFSEPAANCKVKLNIASQSLKQPNPGENLLQPNVLECELPAQPTFKNLPFKVCENVASHDTSNQTVIAKVLNNISDYNRERRVCAWAEQAKNSAAEAMRALAEEKAVSEKRAAGATGLSVDFKSAVFNFKWNLKKEGYSDATIEGYGYILEALVKRGADIFNPESVKEVIAKQNSWSEARKWQVVKAYSAFVKQNGLTWTPPRYKPVQRLPFIPTEQEIDQLIAGCPLQMATFLQLLKETGVRYGEAFNLKWIDVDLENKTVRITPEKSSNPRIFKISNKLAAMLSNLPMKTEKVFTYKNKFYLRKAFLKQRKKIAFKLGNPRLLQIHFHTFRHWKATMEYAKTKDILHVMQLLGHKNIKNTLIYTQLVNFKEDEYVCRVAKTLEQAVQLVEAGFEYVTEMEGLKIFRKRK
jgi:integrase